MCPHYRHCREQLYERSSMTGLPRHRVVKSERRAGMKNRHAVARRVAYLTRPGRRYDIGNNLIGTHNMVKDTVLRPFGNSSGVTIPKAMLDRMHVGNGDRLHLVETDKGVLITPFDPNFEKAMTAYGVVAAKFRNALRELAK